MSVNPMPEGGQLLMPGMVFKDCAKAIEFYKKVFLAEEKMRMHGPDGKKIMHAELMISGCMVFMCDEMPQMEVKSAQTMGGSPMFLNLYCGDADKVFNRAVKAGAKSVKPLSDEFWGDRHGVVLDPFGYKWGIFQRKEQLTMAQVAERGKKAMAAAGKN